MMGFNIKTLYLLLTSLIIITIHLYVRLFNVKKEYSLTLIKENFNQTLIILFIMIILYQSVILIIMLYTLYKKVYKINKNSFIISKMSFILNKIYWEPLEYLFNLIAPDLPYSGTIIICTFDLIEKNKTCRFLFKNSYIFLDYFPRIFVSSIFFFDIVILNKLYYFPYSIMLLLIPILYNIFLKLSYSFFTRNITEVQQYLDIKPLGNPDLNGIYLNFAFSLKSCYIPNEKILQDNIFNYLLLLRIEVAILALKNAQEKYSLFINILCPIIYIYGGVFRLLYILY